MYKSFLRILLANKLIIIINQQ